MISVNNSAENITLGRRGLNNVKSLEFDYNSWAVEFGDGHVVMMNKRQSDAEPYPVALEIKENNIAAWTITSTDTYYAGHGQCELYYIVDDKIKKSAIWKTHVLDSLGEPGEAPDPWKSYVDTVVEAAARAEDAAERTEALLPEEVRQRQEADAALNTKINETKDELTDKIDTKAEQTYVDHISGQLSNRINVVSTTVTENMNKVLGQITDVKNTMNSRISDVEDDIDHVRNISDTHIKNSDIHVTTFDKDRWNNIIKTMTAKDVDKALGFHPANEAVAATKQEVGVVNSRVDNVVDQLSNAVDVLSNNIGTVQGDINQHKNDSSIHVTTAQKNSWDNKADKSYVDEKMVEAGKVQDVTVDNVSVLGTDGVARIPKILGGNTILIQDEEPEVQDNKLWIKENAEETINVYTKNLVDNLISTVPKFTIKVVDSLPVVDISTTTLYLVRDTKEKENNKFTEYIRVNNEWEILGSQELDLSDYATKEYADNVSNIVDGHVDTLREYTQAHVDYSDIHVTAADKQNWGNKVDTTQLYNVINAATSSVGNYAKAHIENNDVHVTSEEKEKWNDNILYAHDIVDYVWSRAQSMNRSEYAPIDKIIDLTGAPSYISAEDIERMGLQQIISEPGYYCLFTMEAPHGVTIDETKFSCSNKIHGMPISSTTAALAVKFDENSDIAVGYITWKENAILMMLFRAIDFKLNKIEDNLSDVSTAIDQRLSTNPAMWSFTEEQKEQAQSALGILSVEGVAF